MHIAEHQSYPTPDSPIERPNIVVLGGGGGASTVAAGLVEHANTTVVVTVSDDGGNTGKWMRRYDTLPVGDARRVMSYMSADPFIAAKEGFVERRLTADEGVDAVRDRAEKLMGDLELISPPLSSSEKVWARQVMDQTVEMAETVHDEEGTLKGSNFGNMALTALYLQTGSLTATADVWSSWTQNRGRVLPVSEVKHTLVMKDIDAEGHEVRVRGEHVIDEYQVQSPLEASLELEPQSPEQKVVIAAEARRAIEEADMAVIAPGSIFTSLLAVLGVEGVKDALSVMQERGGTVVAIGNLVSGPDTQGLHVAQIARKIQDSAPFTHVLHNTDVALLPNGLPLGQVEADDTWEAHGLPLVGQKVTYDPNDVVVRSSIKHDMNAVRSKLFEILEAQRQRLGSTALTGTVTAQA